MRHLISIIIPNYNGSRTIGKCLGSIFAFNDDDREVIVVDDCSEDGSLDIIKKYPCRLVRLEKHAGASAARNAGAVNSKGNILFFIDADCLLQQDTLPIIRKHIASLPANTLVGGTYTPVPYDEQRERYAAEAVKIVDPSGHGLVHHAPMPARETQAGI